MPARPTSAPTFARAWPPASSPAPIAPRLRTREADIRQDKQAARADGVVTPDERRDIRTDERRTSRAIYRQKHDGQVR